VVKTFLETTKHLNAKHEAFFKHWDTLLTKEEKGSMQFRRELWTMTSSEREATGRCFANLVIVPELITVDNSNQKINKYRYSFQKQDSSSVFNFNEAQLSEGDPIVVSDEKGHIALAIGFVSQIRKDRVTVQVDRRLHNTRTRQKGFNEDFNQVFNGIVELQSTQQRIQSQQVCGGDQILYRVDKDEFSNGIAKIRNNLVQLMSPEEANDKHRRLIVDLEVPVFKESPTAYQLATQSNLNDDQKRAVEKVMSGE